MRFYALLPVFLLFLVCTQSLYGQYYGVKEPRQGNWALGLSAGTAILRGDVPADLPAPEAGLFLQKSVSRALDFRVSFHLGSTTGLDISPTSGFRFNSALNGEADSMRFYDSTAQVFLNYQMKYGDLDFLFKLNVNRFFASEGAENWDLFVLAGMAVQFYQTHINAWDESTNNIYPYNNINLSEPDNVKTQLREMLDNSYETPGQQDLVSSSRFGNYFLNTGFVLGGGIRFAVSDHLSLGLQGRYLIVGDDLLDGQQWAPDNQQSTDNDRLVSGSLTFDYSF
ncbi:MAG: hypothetical protein R3C61_03170 [Bacteroidia bacterium]